MKEIDVFTLMNALEQCGYEPIPNAHEAAPAPSKYSQLVNFLNDWFKPTKPTYAVGCSVLLTNERGEILLGRRKNADAAGLYSTPGGRVEPNEDLLQTAMREFAEECGATLRGPVEIVAWQEHFRYGNHYFMFYAHATAYTGEIRNCIPDKSDDWQWHSLAGVISGRIEPCTEPIDVLVLVESRLHGRGGIGA